MQQHPRRPSRRARAVVTLTVALTTFTGLAACGSSDSGGGTTPTLTWYISPDVGNADPSPAKGGQAYLGKYCSDASGGKYRISVELLPTSASQQRQQLLRRLAAGDTSMDIMSIDPPFVPEYAQAGYLAPIPQQYVKDFTEDRVTSSVTASTWKGHLVVAPFHANTELLWYRKSAAQKAGLDMSKPVTWDQLIQAARSSGTSLGVQSALYEGYAVWINALIAGAGGQIVTNPGASGPDIRFGLDSPAGRQAARIISTIANDGVGGPAMSSSNETTSLALFQNKQANFLVNWPYSYAALTGDKSDIAATEYPRTVADKAAAPPYGGLALGVGAKSKHRDLAFQAISCITSERNQAVFMAKSGNPATRRAAYSDPAVLAAFPHGIAKAILTSLDKAVPRPLSQYYGDISTGLQQKFSPPSAVTEQTPADAQRFLEKVLRGQALL